MAIVPVITVTSDNSGFAPFTVHVNAAASNFDGESSQDCVFVWDFGDPTPSVNGNQDNNRYESLGTALTNTTLVQGNFKSKTRFPIPTIDCGVDNTGFCHRSGDSNSEQQGLNAAYTYYHDNGGTPFTITLTIIHNGVESSSTTTTIAVTAPTIYTSWTTAEINNSGHAVNSANSWVTISVNPSFSDNPATGASKNFSSLENAMTWVNNFRSKPSLGGVNGRVRIVLNNTSGQYLAKIANTINITVNDLVFTVNDNNYQRVFKIMPATSGDLASPGSPIPMISINSGTKNIYFEHITFQGVRTDYNTTESSATPTSSSNVYAIQIEDASNIALHNCGFIGCYHGIYSISLASECIYLNRMIIGGGGTTGYVSRYSVFNLSGTNIVVSGVDIGNFDLSTIYDPNSPLIYLGEADGVDMATIQWCYLDAAVSSSTNYGDSSNYGFLYATSTLHNGGAIRTYSSSNVFVISSILSKGCNIFEKSSNIRLDGNYMTGAGGGQKVSVASPVMSSQYGIITLGGDIDGLTVVNNVLELRYNNLMGNVFCSSSTIGVKNAVKVANNTTVLWSNVSSLIGVWDFTEQGSSCSGYEFVNNLFVSNRIGVMCRFVKYDNELIFTNTSNNVFPEFDSGVRFAHVNGSPIDNESWLLTTVGANDQFYNVEIGDTFVERKFAYDSEKYPNLIAYATTVPYVNQDYAKAIRTVSADWSVGATRAVPHLTLFPNSASEDSVITVATPIARNRPTNANATLNDSHNLYLEIYDPNILHQDDSDLFSNKRLIGQSYGARTIDVGSGYLNLLNNVGDYIKTTITTADTTDGIDVTIVYTNDGPIAQTAGSTAQRLGSIDLDYVFLGRNNSLMYNQNSFFIDSSAMHVSKAYTTTNSALTYPTNRFAPVTTYLTDTHAITVCVIADFVNNDKFIQEKTSGRSDASSYLIGRGKTSLEWINNTFNNHCLQRGESFSVTVSVRISRDPSRWVLTTKPLRDYLQANFPTLLSKDPRPVYLENLNSNFDGSTPLQLNASYQITSTGYAIYRAAVITNVFNKGYERYMVWDTLGQNTGGLNYYPQIVTPIYRNQSPWTSYPNMLATISEFNRLGEEIPTFIFYQGYGDLALTSSVAYGPTSTYGTIDFTDSALMQKFYDEMDIVFDVYWAGGVGLDFFGASTNEMQVKNSLDLLDVYMERYPNAHLMGEKARPDIFLSRMASFLFSDQGAYSPHDLANYLVPGNEHWLVDYGPTRTDEYPTSEEEAYRLKLFAEYGYVSGVYSPSQYVGLNASSSDYEAVDRRFDYVEVPNDYTPTEAPATPTNLNYGFYSNVRSTTYTTATRMYIKLTWSPNQEPDFSHYIVYKSKITNQVVDPNPANFQRKKYSKDAFFYDTAVRIGKTYYYQVSAVDVFGNESAKSSVIAVTFVADDPALNPPTNIAAEANYNERNISITWSS